MEDGFPSQEQKPLTDRREIKHSSMFLLILLDRDEKSGVKIVFRRLVSMSKYIFGGFPGKNPDMADLICLIWLLECCALY